MECGSCVKERSGKKEVEKVYPDRTTDFKIGEEIKTKMTDRSGSSSLVLLSPAFWRMLLESLKHKSPFSRRLLAVEISQKLRFYFYIRNLIKARLQLTCTE